MSNPEPLPLYQRRLQVSLAPLLRHLEEFLDENTASGADRWVYISPEEIRTVHECLLHLGLTQDAENLVEPWGRLARWMLGPRLDEALLALEASSPEMGPWMREHLGPIR